MAHLKLSGILSLTLDEEAIKEVHRLQGLLPPEAKPLADADLHVTLWKLNRDTKKILERYLKDDLLTAEGLFPTVMPQDKIYRAERKEMTLERDGRVVPAKKSWFVLVEPYKEFLRCRTIVHGIANLYNIELDEYESTNRPYHISIANLTGRPFDSIGDITWSDAMTEADRAFHTKMLEDAGIEPEAPKEEEKKKEDEKT